MVDKATEDEWVRRVAQGEGFTATKKRDPSGRGYCVGYGHNLDTSGRGPQWVKSMTGKDINKGDKLTTADADKICRADLKTTYDALDERFPWWKELDPASQYVMVDMCYTMGADNLAQFKKMLGALREGDYETASKEMLNSKYAKQTGQRARKNAELMRTGEWSDDDPKFNESLYKRPTRVKGQDVTKAQVKDDTEKAREYGAKKEAETRQVAQTKAKDDKVQKQTAAPRAAAPAPKQTTAPAKTGNATDKDVARMRSMLNNMNKANGKNKKIDIDKTIDDLTAQYGSEASKILTKAMMSPTSVAKKMNLRDKDGKLLASSRQIIQRLSQPENEQERDNALAMVAARRRGRGGMN